MINSNLLLTSSNHEDKPFKFSMDLDTDFLNKNYSENLDLAVSIFDHFNDNIDAEMKTLEENIVNNDYEAIRAIAHKIKNNFTYVGASNLSTLTKQIEIEAKEENASVIETYNQFKLASENTLNSITDQLESIKKYLQNR